MASHPKSSAQVRSSQNYIWNKGDVLGHGATCEVYKAFNKRTGEPAAVKVFNKGGASRDMYQQQRELQLVKRLEHKNLVKVLAIEEENDVSKSIVVMEICLGGSLFNFLSLPTNRNGLCDDELMRVLSDVTQGVKYLRENNVVHRDLKPGNIMRCINEDGTSLYKLTDFGGARELEQGECFMSLHGTEEYLHPDIYEKALVDKRATTTFKAEVDLWSLGATFYHCIAGQTPFRPYGGRQNKELMLKMISKKDAGVISGVQTVDNGTILYSKELPALSPLNQSLKTLMEPLLGKLLERNTEMGISFVDYFKEIEKISDLTPVYILDVSNCEVHKLFISKSGSYEEFQSLICTYTKVDPEDQIILTERCIELENISDNFMRYDQFYIFSKSCKPDETKTSYIRELSDVRYSAMKDDILAYDRSLGFAICTEAHKYNKELQQCRLHVKLIKNAILSLVDYCEDTPGGLKSKMKYLIEKSKSVESKRKDILQSNQAFVSILQTSINVLANTDPHGDDKVSVFDDKLKLKLRSITDSDSVKVRNDVSNRLEIPRTSSFSEFLCSIQDVGLKAFIKALIATEDQGARDFVLSTLAADYPMTVAVSLLERTNTNLSQWADHKRNSGNNIDEQLEALMARIQDIQSNAIGLDADTERQLMGMDLLDNIMKNVLLDMETIQKQFDEEKSQRPPIRMTSTLKAMHLLHRNYLHTLKQRARDITVQALDKCSQANQCLKSRLTGFMELQESFKKYEKEYNQDVDMFSEHVQTMEQWKELIFSSLNELGLLINDIKFPVIDSNCTKLALLNTLNKFEEMSMNNKRLCEENTKLIQQILNF